MAAEELTRITGKYFRNQLWLTAGRVRAGLGGGKSSVGLLLARRTGSRVRVWVPTSARRRATNLNFGGFWRAIGVPEPALRFRS